MPARQEGGTVLRVGRSPATRRSLPLAANGGPTPTRAPVDGSPAIDHSGTRATGCPAADQRGVSRPQGPACDIGAVEVQVPG